MTEPLEVVPRICATVALGLDVMHVRGCRHASLCLALGTQRIGPQEHQPQTLPAAAIATLSRCAAPGIMRSVGLLAPRTAPTAHPITHQARTASPLARASGPAWHYSIRPGSVARCSLRRHRETGRIAQRLYPGIAVLLTFVPHAFLTHTQNLHPSIIGACPGQKGMGIVTNCVGCVGLCRVCYPSLYVYAIIF